MSRIRHISRLSAMSILVLLSLVVTMVGPMPVSAQTDVFIMPLGDSITDGAAGSTDDTGYRRQLYLSLTGAGYSPQFVGSQTSGIPTDFDRDHEGHGGWHANQIRDSIIGWLDTQDTAGNTVDIVLLHIGTNDISGDPQTPAEIAAEIGEILDNIDTWETSNSHVIWVVLARIINRTDSKVSQTTQLNSEIQTLAEARIAAGDKLFVVDMEPALDYPGDMDDSVHPNDSGYGKMAGVWFDALDEFLPFYLSADPDLFRVSLDASSPDNLPSDDLTCSYYINDASTTAATAWTRGGSPEMRFYLPMEGGATNALLDYSGSGNDGTPFNSPTWNATAGHDGHGAFYFDGDDYIVMPNVMPTGSSGAYTKAAWVKTDTDADRMDNIISGSTGGHAMWVKDYSGMRLTAGHNGSWNQVEDPAAWVHEVWTHAAVTYDPSVSGGLLILYKDGVEVDRETSVATHSDDTLRVGTYNNTCCTYKGYLDDARLYDRVLSPEQIASLHSAGRDVVVNQETESGDTWQCQVTPFSDSAAGSTESSNDLVIFSDVSATGVSLTSTSGSDLDTDDLTCSYTLEGSATTAATGWTKDGGSIMSLHLPMEGGPTRALQDVSGNGFDAVSSGDPTWSATAGYDGHGAYVFDGNDDLSAGEHFPTTSNT